MSESLVVPAAAYDEDPFAAPRAEHPGAKFIRCIHRGCDVEFILIIEAGTEWFDLLPSEQTVEIKVQAH